MADHEKKIYDVIEEAGYAPTSYSGRGMYGKHCLGVVLPLGELFDLGKAVGEAGVELGTPVTDSMGNEIVAYWPRIPAPPSEPEDEEP